MRELLDALSHHLGTGDLASAEAALRAAAGDPERALGVTIGRGLLCAARQDEVGARAALAEALLQAPDEPAVVHAAASAELALGNLVQAEQLARHAAKRWDGAPAWTLLGAILRTLGEAAAAVEALETAAQRDPDTPDLWMALADARMSAGDLLGALDALGVHALIAPDDAAPLSAAREALALFATEHGAAVNALAARDDAEGPLRDLLDAVVLLLEPQIPEVLRPSLQGDAVVAALGARAGSVAPRPRLFLARLLVARGDRETARVLVDAAAPGSDPEDRSLRALVEAELWEAGGERDAAIAAYRDALALAPHPELRLDARANLASLLLADDPAGARAVAAGVPDWMRDAFAPLRLNEAVAELRLGHPEAAQRLLVPLTVSHDSEVAAAAQELLSDPALRSRGRPLRPDSGVRPREPAFAMPQTVSEALALLARMGAVGGRWALERAVERAMGPDPQVAAAAQATLWLDAGRPDEAVAALDAVDGDDVPELRLLRARGRAMLGDAAGAWGDVEAALEHTAPGGASWLAVELALEQGDIERAASFLGPESAGETAGGLRARARVALARGEVSAAATWLGRAFAVDPFDAEVHSLILQPLAEPGDAVHFLTVTRLLASAEPPPPTAVLLARLEVEAAEAVAGHPGLASVADVRASGW